MLATSVKRLRFEHQHDQVLKLLIKNLKVLTMKISGSVEATEHVEPHENQ